MTLIRRVIIDPDTFRVSIPGRDVSRTRMEESTFDASFPMVGTAFKGQKALGTKEKNEIAFPGGVSFTDAPILLWGWFWNRAPTVLYPPNVRQIPGNNTAEPYASVSRTNVTFYNEFNFGGVHGITVKWKVLI